MMEEKIINNEITDTKDKLELYEQHMIEEAMKRVKDPFKLMTVEEVMKDLRIGYVTAYNIFRRSDFPAIHVGKTKTVTTLAYLLWKMKNQSKVVSNNGKR